MGLGAGLGAAADDAVSMAAAGLSSIGGLGALSGAVGEVSGESTGDGKQGAARLREGCGQGKGMMGER